MAKKTDQELTADDAAIVAKLQREAEQKKRDDDTATVNALEAEPTPEELEAQQLSAIESVEASDDDTPAQSEPQQTNTETPAVTDKDARRPKLAGTGPWWKRRKIIIPLGIAGVLLIVGLLQLIQPIRFMTFGWLQRPVVVTIYDASSKAPLDTAMVTIDHAQYKTDNKGEVHAKIAVGRHEARVTKDNYKSTTVPLTVDVFSTVKARSDLVPTGKPVTITIVNRVTGQPIVGAVIDGGKKTLAKSDTKGVARLVVPLDKKTVPVTVRADHYRVSETEVTLETKEVQLVPEGSLLFLSKASGKIDVVKTNLDGSERKTIVAGTGAEEDRGTTLLASRDWQKLMLLSRRDTAKSAGLSVIDAASGTAKPIDQSAASISLIGWSGHAFIYMTTTPQDPGKGYKAGAIVLKSYNADTDKITVLDQNASEANETLWEEFTTGYITDKGIVYGKVWNTSYTAPRTILAGKQSTIAQVRADGTDKKTLAGFDAVTTTWIEPKLYEPQGVYFRIGTNKDGAYGEAFAEVEDGAYAQVKTKPAGFDDAIYPTFLLSPNGKTVFWAESRDGKNVLFTGDRLGQNKQEIVKVSEFTPYGWLGDDKVLLQKGGSELYVTTLDAMKQGVAPLKIGDYHKANTIVGYGYGYGAQ